MPDRRIAMIGFLQAQSCSNSPASWRHPGSAGEFMTPEVAASPHFTPVGQTGPKAPHPAWHHPADSASSAHIWTCVRLSAGPYAFDCVHTPSAERVRGPKMPSIGPGLMPWLASAR